MPTYPGSGAGGSQITVDAALKQPQLIARALTDLAAKRFVADKIFAHGTPEQVAGGAAQFQRSETIYPDQGAEEVGIRSDFPRAGWTEQIFTAFVKKYGLEAPIAYEAQRRNQMDVLQRAQIKIANAVVKFVDTTAMNLILNDPDKLTAAVSAGAWSGTPNIVADLANARLQIVKQDEGYEPDTLILGDDLNYRMLLDTNIRAAMPRETQESSIQTGRAPVILGFRQVLVTPVLNGSGKAIIMSSTIGGTIADEAPLAGERYVSYSAGAGFPTVWSKVYEEEEDDEYIVRGARFPAMWLAEPKSIFVLTGAGT